MIKFLKFIPVQLTFCLVVGILFGYFFVIDVTQIVIVLTFSFFIFSGIYIYANARFEPLGLFSAATLLITFLVGVSAITFKNEQNQKQFYANQADFSIEKPQTAVLKIHKILKPSNYSTKYEAEIIQLNSKKALGKILLNIERDSLFKLLKVDDKIAVKILFNEIQNPKNPYEFNYKNYLNNQQIHYQIYLQKKDFLILESTNSIEGIAAKIRDKINVQLVKNGFENDELGVINALLLGQRQTISEELMQSYAGAGAIHILAVSGLHVGIILLMLTFLFKPLHYFKHGKLIASVIVVIALWSFAILAGFSASVVRAVAMFTAIAIGLHSNSASNVYNTLIISIFFLLLINPYYLFEVGFQLSYLAVFSIVWIQPKIYKQWQPKLLILDKLWQLFTVSIAAQIGVLPLSLYYFHQFPGLFFVSNLVIIPVLGIILGLGIFVIVLAVLNILPMFLGNIYFIIIQQMNNFISWVSGHEYFIIKNITFSFGLLITSYIFIFFMLKWTEKKNFNRMLLVFFSIIAIQIVFIFEKYEFQKANNFIVFNKSKESIIGIRFGEKLTINSSIPNLTSNENPIKNYLIGTGIENVSISENMGHLYFFKKDTILIIDSLGTYNLKSIKPTIILLRQSPKINLDRLIVTMHPRLIIAEGSNYKNYISRWEVSCNKNKTPFYSTMQKGAFMIQ